MERTARATLFAWLALPLLGVACASPAAKRVRTLAEIEPPRSAEHPESLERAARWIAQELAACGLAPRFESYEVDGETFRNVTALIGRGDRPRVVVGAHYDVYGDQPGADDDASGVAALLQVACELADRDLRGDVEVVAFVLEEPPFFRSEDMGSARHAKALAESGVAVRAMLSLEMLGFYRDEPGSQSYPQGVDPSGLPDAGDFLAVVGRASEERELLERLTPPMRAAGKLPVLPWPATPDVQEAQYSDHLSFWKRGFLAVMVTDTAFLRNPNYHAPGDRPETLDFERLEAAADAVAAGVAVLAGESEP